MKHYKMAWYLITNKAFRYWLKYTIKYALVAYNNTRGSGASDVLYFHTNRNLAQKVFSPEFLKIVRLESENFKPVTREPTFSRTI